jgi:hypothetical protein
VKIFLVIQIVHFASYFTWPGEVKPFPPVIFRDLSYSEGRSFSWTLLVFLGPKSTWFVLWCVPNFREIPRPPCLTPGDLYESRVKYSSSAGTVNWRSRHEEIVV